MAAAARARLGQECMMCCVSKHKQKDFRFDLNLTEPTSCAMLSSKLTACACRCWFSQPRSSTVHKSFERSKLEVASLLESNFRKCSGNLQKAGYTVRNYGSSLKCLKPLTAWLILRFTKREVRDYLYCRMGPYCATTFGSLPWEQLHSAPVVDKRALPDKKQTTDRPTVWRRARRPCHCL